MFVILIPFFAECQETGIKFESGLTWKDIRVKAKAENKYIFMDCYATWCGPCKWMSQHIFSEGEVGEYMNSHFISVAVQMDKEPNDDLGTKNWYADADSISRAFNIDDYPTYLFFSPDGEPVHRFSGSIDNSKVFMTKVSDALDSTTQYYTSLEKWKSHRGDSAFLFQQLNIAMGQGDWNHARVIGEAYFSCLRELITDKNDQLIYDLGLIQTSADKWFKLFDRNTTKINELHEEINGKKIFAEWVLGDIIYKESITPLQESKSPLYWHKISTLLERKYPLMGKDLTRLLEPHFKKDIAISIENRLRGNNVSDITWKKIANELKFKYPDYDWGKIFFETKSKYYFQVKQWSHCADAAYALIHKYGNSIDFKEINDIAWDYIFMHCDNRMILNEALKWMKRATNNSLNGEALDTYANLLYKTGKTENALAWENKAVQRVEENDAKSDDLKTLQANLNKMLKGEPTWEE